MNNGKDNLGKFDAKSDEAIFLGYSTNSKAYRVFDKRTLTVEESIHITFNKNVFLTIETNEVEDNETTIIEKKDTQKKEKENNQSFNPMEYTHSTLMFPIY